VVGCGMMTGEEENLEEREGGRKIRSLTPEGKNQGTSESVGGNKFDTGLVSLAGAGTQIFASLRPRSCTSGQAPVSGGSFSVAVHGVEVHASAMRTGHAARYHMVGRG
jgi:hypothetical protein